MTEHDQQRMNRALNYLGDENKNEENLLDAIRGLQSTDDPLLVPLYEQLLEEYRQLKLLKEKT
jgi:hypothetical protein